jgi:hypothetical protein
MSNNVRLAFYPGVPYATVEFLNVRESAHISYRSPNNNGFVNLKAAIAISYRTIRAFDSIPRFIWPRRHPAPNGNRWRGRLGQRVDSEGPVRQRTCREMVKKHPELKKLCSQTSTSAENIAAQCSMYTNGEISGKKVWKGKCSVETINGDTSRPVLSVVSWRDFIYDKKHPDFDRQYQCGPWLNIYISDVPGTLHAQWGSDGSCHGGDTVAVIKTGEGSYRGDNFAFTWRKAR